MAIDFSSILQKFEERGSRRARKIMEKMNIKRQKLYYR